MVGSASDLLLPGPSAEAQAARTSYSGLELLGRADSWFDAADITSTDQQTLPNRGRTSVTLGRGVGAGVDTYDPTFNVGGPITADGVDNFMQHNAGDAPTFSATAGQFTVIVCLTTSVLSGAWNRVFSSESAGNNGVYMALDNLGRVRLVTGGLSSSMNAITADARVIEGDGEVHVVAGVIDNGSAYVWDDTSSFSSAADITGVGTITHGTPRTMGPGYTISNMVAGDLHSVALFQSVALSVTELGVIATHLIREHS